MTARPAMSSAIMMTTRPASGLPPVIALITSPASTGRGHRDAGRDDHQQQEERDEPPVRPGETEHPQRRGPTDSLVAKLVLAPHRAHHAPAAAGHASHRMAHPRHLLPYPTCPSSRLSAHAKTRLRQLLSGPVMFQQVRLVRAERDGPSRKSRRKGRLPGQETCGRALSIRAGATRLGRRCPGCGAPAPRARPTPARRSCARRHRRAEP